MQCHHFFVGGYDRQHLSFFHAQKDNVMILTLGACCKCGEMIIVHNKKTPQLENGYEANLTWCFLF
jgi:hypothetical protein